MILSGINSAFCSKAGQKIDQSEINARSHTRLNSNSTLYLNCVLWLLSIVDDHHIYQIEFEIISDFYRLVTLFVLKRYSIRVYKASISNTSKINCMCTHFLHFIKQTHCLPAKKINIKFDHQTEFPPNSSYSISSSIIRDKIEICQAIPIKLNRCKHVGCISNQLSTITSRKTGSLTKHICVAMMENHDQISSHDDKNQVADEPNCCPRLEIATEKVPGSEQESQKSIFLMLLSGLGWLDRLLSPLIVIAMVLGVVIGEYAANAKENLSKGNLYGVSAPLVIGLIVMMWPILTKVPFESLHRTFQTSRLWSQIGMSLLLNWIVGPFLMLGLAWATLPDLETYRTGIIMVGLARCIAMVMIWNNIAQGDAEVCAILVIINSILQMALYAPYCIWFINVISHTSQSFTLQYGTTAISVLIYLGIPLGAGVVTRFGVMWLLGKKRFYNTFLPFFGPLSLIGLLYTIIIIFASQSKRILDNLGPTFRTFVPLVLYFAIMWTFTFVLVWRLSLRESKTEDVERDTNAQNNLVQNEKSSNDQPRSENDIQQRRKWGYEMAVVQAFTAGSNNFELAIAVAVAVYGADSDQALAATIGPLVEVPVLLILSWVALWLRKKLCWDKMDKKPINQSMEIEQ